MFPWYNSVPCSFGTEVSAFSSAVRWGLLPAPRGPCSSWSCSPFYRPFQVAGHFFKASERISPSSQLRLSLKTMGCNPRSDCSIIFAIYCMLMKGASIPPNTQRGLFSMCTPRAGISGGDLVFCLPQSCSGLYHSQVRLVISNYLNSNLMLDFLGNKVRYAFYFQRAYGTAKRRRLQQELL